MYNTYVFHIFKDWNFVYDNSIIYDKDTDGAVCSIDNYWPFNVHAYGLYRQYNNPVT